MPASARPKSPADWRFRSGKVYRYFEFLAGQYDELPAAESKGGYFAEGFVGGSSMKSFTMPKMRRTEVRPISSVFTSVAFDEDKRQLYLRPCQSETAHHQREIGGGLARQ